jgi:hypothetical protein
VRGHGILTRQCRDYNRHSRNAGAPVIPSAAVEAAPVDEPFRRDEIARDLTRVREWSARYWEHIADREMFAPIDGGWSPLDHVRHLVKSNRPVAKALVVPRILLFLRFGRASQPSSSYSQLVARYRGALAGGLQAGGYSPSPLPPERHTGEEKARSLGRLDDTFAALLRALEGWSERALDRRRLPHPGMGLLTVREMLFFTLYHNTHHVLGVERHRADGSGG